MTRPKGKGSYVHTVWLDYKHPVLGFQYTPIGVGDLFTQHDVKRVAIKIVPISELCSAQIGNIDHDEIGDCPPFEWLDKASAQYMATRVKGYVETTWKPVKEKTKKKKRSTG